MICCTGIGADGFLTLGRTLEEHPEIDTVCEFGTAASISKGVVGRIYECTTFCDFDGNIIASSPSFTQLPTAAVVGDDNVYTGHGCDWADLLEMPLLYTMETLRFRQITLEFRRHFCSLRLVSDNGKGNIREKVITELEKAKPEVLKVLNQFSRLKI